jgi:hypothetical protein
MSRTRSFLSAVFVLLSVAACSAQDGPRYSHTGSALISDVRVIDGLGNAPRQHQDILVVDGRISSMGSTGSLNVPTDAL